MKEASRLRIDVLIIGGGLAALRAAIAARETGATTAIAVKGLLGRSGSSAITTGGFAAVVPGLTEGDSPEIHAKDTLEAGAGIGDPELIRIVCEEAGQEVEWMEKFGGRFFHEPDGQLYLEPSGEHAFPRVLVPEKHIGVDFTLPMSDYVRALGVEIFENTMCLEVLVQDGRVGGAVCLDIKQEELLLFETANVILCTGGCGNLFSFTSNPRDVTGDGYALAFEAGAELRDMEFIQFYPWRCINPFDKARVSVQPPTFVKGGKLLNANGERFMKHYDPKRLDGTTRDLAARGIFDQIRQGLGIENGVLLDLSEMSEEEFRRYNPKMWKALQAKKLDYRSTTFIVAPEAHYFMGGVKIDSFGRSTVEGLYAAGETAGGIHGANRANSNALPEIMVIGARAGRNAGEAAQSRDSEAVKHPVMPQRWAQWLEQIDAGREVDASLAGTETISNIGSFGTASSTDYKAETALLRKEMDRALGIIRNEADMRKGLEIVSSMLQSVAEQPPVDPALLRTWREFTMLARVGQLCLTAAMRRSESRGAHFREDQPERLAAWDGISLVVRRGSSDLIEALPGPSAVRADEVRVGQQTGGAKR